MTDEQTLLARLRLERDLALRKAADAEAAAIGLGNRVTGLLERIAELEILISTEKEDAFGRGWEAAMQNHIRCIAELKIATDSAIDALEGMRRYANRWEGGK